MTHKFVAALSACLIANVSLADPCGMVPPIHIPEGSPGIVRTGDQITYSFFADGMQSIAIRPGFTGDVDNFGMLVPFPTPPSMKKMADETFKHLEAAVDAPFVDIHLYDNTPRPSMMRSVAGSAAPEAESLALDDGLKYNEVRVLNEEAIGMYEVAVLEAGSPKALERWMNKNEYRYPEGMDDVVLDYVQSRWVFVAVKAKVGQMPGVTPKPGMRGVQPDLPPGADFNGYVQGMVFRFHVDEPVIPMRLSTFNGDDAHNRVYFLSERPMKIDGLSSEFVQRQVSGAEVYENVAGLLPYRIHNGNRSQITKDWWTQIDAQRDPTPYSGVARAMFASDLVAVQTGDLVLPYEKEEKELLNLSESFGIRGPEVDALHAEAMTEMREEALEGAIRGVAGMTLNVIEGDFPQKYLQDNNLTFASYAMPSSRNTPEHWTKRPQGPQVWVPFEGGGGWFR